MLHIKMNIYEKVYIFIYFSEQIGGYIRKTETYSVTNACQTNKEGGKSANIYLLV